MLTRRLWTGIVIGALFGLFVSLVIVVNAEALGSECSSGPGWYEDASSLGSSYWCGGTNSTQPEFRYSKGTTEIIKRRVEGVAIQGGDTGAADIVPASTANDQSAVGRLIFKLRGAGPGVGEDISNGWANYMADIGTYAKVGSLLKGVGTIGLGVLAFQVGYKIGEGIGPTIRGWLGIGPASGEVEPEENKGLEGPGKCGSACWESVEAGSPRHIVDVGGYHFGGEEGSSNAYYTPGPGDLYIFSHYPYYGYGFSSEAMIVGSTESNIRLSPTCATESFFWPKLAPPQGLTVYASPSPVYQETECGEPLKNVKEGWATPVAVEVLGDGYGQGVNQIGFPGNETNVGSPNVKGEGATVPKPEPLKVAPPLPTVPLPGTTHIQTKEIVREIIHEVDPEHSPETKPEEEEKLALTEIPQPLPNEVGSAYKTRIEGLGFTKVTLSTLPEVAIDPKVGPEGVSYTVPAEGIRVAPATTDVTVEQNPATAPTPGAPEGGGITPPGINFPKFGVLCKGFPFGVPCWLAKTIEGWSATGKAPVWGVEEFEVHGKKIKGLTFDFAKLEPLMEKIRPALIIFATIGLVLLFYRFAKGGSPPSGSGEGSGDSKPEGGG